MFVDAALLKVHSRALNYIRDDLLVYVSDLCVRHFGWFALSRGGGVVLLLRCAIDHGRASEWDEVW